jgi:hypothetical protein
VTERGQQVVGPTIQDVKDAPAGAGFLEICARLSAQATDPGARVEKCPTDGIIRSADPAWSERDASPLRKLLDPHRPIRGTPHVAVVRQAVAENDNVIEIGNSVCRDIHRLIVADTGAGIACRWLRLGRASPHAGPGCHGSKRSHELGLATLEAQATFLPG